MNDAATSSDPTLPDPSLTMAEILQRHPGAQRALFRKYHIGGCSSCGFAPGETLADLCARNNHLPIDEVRAWILECDLADRAMQLTPLQVRDALQQSPHQVRLLDIRTREEFDAVAIPQSHFFTQELMQEILMRWPREGGWTVIIDHQGTRSLDAAAYFQGHGFQNVRAMAGGIDAWSREADPSLPRYALD